MENLESTRLNIGIINKAHYLNPQEGRGIDIHKKFAVTQIFIHPSSINYTNSNRCYVQAQEAPLVLTKIVNQIKSPSN